MKFAHILGPKDQNQTKDHIRNQNFLIFISNPLLHFLKLLFIGGRSGVWGGFFLFLVSCDSGFEASKLVFNYITISSPSPINRANMSSYSLNGTCVL